MAYGTDALASDAVMGGQGGTQCGQVIAGVCGRAPVGPGIEGQAGAAVVVGRAA